MLAIRRSRDHLIFIMGNPIPAKTVFFIETGSCLLTRTRSDNSSHTQEGVKYPVETNTRRFTSLIIVFLCLLDVPFDHPEIPKNITFPYFVLCFARPLCTLTLCASIMDQIIEMQIVLPLRFSFERYKHNQQRIPPSNPHYQNDLTHLPLVPHICVNELGKYWFR